MVKKNTNKLKKILIILSVFIAAVVLIYIVKKLLRDKNTVDKNLCSPSNLRGNCDKGNYCTSSGVCKKCPTLGTKISTNTDFNILICKEVNGKLQCLEPGDQRARFVKADGTAGIIGEAARFKFLENGNLDDKSQKPIDLTKKYTITVKDVNGIRKFLGSSCKNINCKEGQSSCLFDGFNGPGCCSADCLSTDTKFYIPADKNPPPKDAHQPINQTCNDRCGDFCKTSPLIQIFKIDMKTKIVPVWNSPLTFLQPECKKCDRYRTGGGLPNYCAGCNPSGIGCAVLLGGGAKFFKLIQPSCGTDEGDTECEGGEVCIDRKCKFIGC
jgi:hypothetical protein